MLTEARIEREGLRGKETYESSSVFAPEGRLPIVATAALAATVSVALGSLVAVPLWGAVIALGLMYRDPPRTVPALPLALVGPADGRIASVRLAADPWLQRDALRTAIRLPWLGVGPLRSPTEGKVMDYRLAREAEQRADSYVVPRRFAVYNAMWVRTDEGDDVVLVVSSRWSFHRLRFSVSVGERVGQGQRCGFSHFGSRVDVLAPSSTRSQVDPGQPVMAGSTVIASLVHE